MDFDDSYFCLEEDEVLFQKIDEDLDLAFALSLQEEINEEASQGALKVIDPITKSSGSSNKPLSIIDPQWELIDPNPDIHSLFIEFNTQFFWGKLLSVEVRWSPRMTYCAGVCCYEGRGGLCSVRLSTPLLKLRPRSDLVETLIHEMIHAYLFVTANNKDHDAHGPEFLKHMHRINKQSGAKISVYHTFHDEVDFQRKHWWKCDGPCKSRRPYYGIVKRAMNRPPGPNDTWWSQHQSSCGGKFTKIKEPENFKQKSLKRKQIQEIKDKKSSSNIKSFFQPSASSSNSINSKKRKEDVDIHTIKSIFAKEDNLVPVGDVDSKTSTQQTNICSTPFSGQGFTLGSSSSAPTSLLSKIRKELGYRPCNSVQQMSVTSTKSKVKTDINSSSKSPVSSSVKKFTKGASSSSLVVSPYSSASKVESKLKQSSLDKFVDSPFKIPGKQNDPSPKNCSTTVACPVCFSFFPDAEINIHLDKCLLTNA